jgi:hypothetical protein
MGLTILAGGGRHMTATGKIEAKRGNAYTTQGTGRIEPPHAQELAAIRANRWISTDTALPPKATPILYLEHSATVPAGTVHCGHYDRRRRQYLEQGSGSVTPANRVIAWMPVPEIPEAISLSLRAANRAYLD